MVINNCCYRCYFQPPLQWSHELRLNPLKSVFFVCAFIMVYPGRQVLIHGTGNYHISIAAMQILRMLLIRWKCHLAAALSWALLTALFAVLPAFLCSLYTALFTPMHRCRWWCMQQMHTYGLHTIQPTTNNTCASYLRALDIRPHASIHT